MSAPNWSDYRKQLLRLADLTTEARQIAVEATDEGHNAKNVRANLYSAIKYLNAAAGYVSRDLIHGQPDMSTVDRQYERDLS